MEHGGGAHAGADIGRAGGEVAEGGGERKFEFVFERGVKFVGGLPSLEQMKTGAKGLEADVILLIDHDGKGFVPVDDKATARVFGGVFTANEMFFDEELFIEGSESFHGHGDFGWAHRGELGHGGLNRFEEF